MPLLAPVELAAGGPRVSRIVAGAWRLAEWGFDRAARRRWIDECLAEGVTTFDHADIYGSYSAEGLFGEVIAADPSLRQRLQLVTKFGIRLVTPNRPAHAIKSYDSSRRHVTESVEQSLRQLHTDHIDLLLVHRPDLLMDPAELAEAFAALRAAGKVLHFGVSNHSPSQFALLQRRTPLVTNQVELSALQMRALADGTLEQCLDLGLRPMIWSPLAGGRLFDAGDPQAQRVRSALESIGRDRGASAATVAHAWILRHPSGPVPIVGSRRIEALREAVAATTLDLGREDWYRVWQASMGREVD